MHIFKKATVIYIEVTLSKIYVVSGRGACPAQCSGNQRDKIRKAETANIYFKQLFFTFFHNLQMRLCVYCVFVYACLFDCVCGVYNICCSFMCLKCALELTKFSTFLQDRKFQLYYKFQIIQAVLGSEILYSSVSLYVTMSTCMLGQSVYCIMITTRSL